MKLQVKNFRCFEKTSSIELNNINLFIGPNGSGKSSFLRILPLLKQSVRTQHTSPILWSYNNYLDFGNFKTTVFNNKLTMSFGITQKDNRSFYIRRIHRSRDINKNESFDNQVLFTIARKNNFIEYVKSIQLRIMDESIHITSEKKGDMILVKDIRINDHTFSFNKTKLFLQQVDNRILPIVSNDKKIKSTISLFTRHRELLSNELMDNFISDLGHVKVRFSKRNSVKQQKEAKEFTIEQLLNKNNSNPNNMRHRQIDIIELLLERDYFDNNDLKEFEIEMLERYKILIFLNEYLSFANDIIVQLANSVTYLAPFRAQAERYYLVQDLIDNELDSRGFNIPSYLTIMKANNSSRFRRLNKWILDNFGFEINLKNAGNHTQLRISENDNLSNIADTGFGYSQLLPLLVHLWEALESKKEKILIIEQPELHLHPKLQAMFIDAVVKITQNNAQIRVVIESHSETIINRIGQHIRNNSNVSSLVSIYITEKNKNVSLRKTKFDKSGLIEDWPINFLSPGDFRYDS